MTSAVDLDDIETALAEAERSGDAALAAVLVEQIEEWARWEPLPHQEIPAWDWTVWALIAGRGTGKSDAGAAAMDAHMLSPPCDPRVPGGHRGRIIGPTFGDAIAACVNGPSGIKAHNPNVQLVGTKEGTLLYWPGGATARVFGAHSPGDVDRLRAGSNACFDWFDELAAFRHIDEAWDQASFGRRLGPHPRLIVTTTPRNRERIRWIVRMGEYAAIWSWLHGREAIPRRARLAISTATTADNPHLDAEVRAALYDAYGGTRLGEQELLGRLVDDLGTFFSRSWFGYRDGWPDVGGQTVRYWDLAATPPGPTNDDPDWTVGARVTLDPDHAPLGSPAGTVMTGAWNIDDLVRVRSTAAKVEQTIVETARADGPRVTVAIEQDPGQAGVAQLARYKTILAHAGLRVVGNSPTGPKEVRAQIVAAAAEQSRVTLTRGAWNTVLLDELEEFPDGGHDDIVDALSGAFLILSGAKRTKIVGPGGDASRSTFRGRV